MNKFNKFTRYKINNQKSVPFHTLTNYLKKKLINNLFYSNIKKNKFLKNELNKGGERFVH